jgi:hypothetical protein
MRRHLTLLLLTGLLILGCALVFAPGLGGHPAHVSRTSVSRTA